MSESTFDAGVNMLNDANTAPVADNAPASTPQVPANNTPAPAAPQSEGAGHPAWQKHLAKIPEGFHPVVKPAFEEWDKAVQDRLSEVQSKYNPYKHFVESRTDPTQLREAYELYQLIQSDPRRVYDAMAQNFGFADQGQLDESDDDEYDLGEDGQGQVDLSKDPRFQQLEQQQQQIVAAMQAAQEQQLERQGEQWLDSKMTEATEIFKAAGIEPTREAWAYILNTTMGLGQSMDNDAAFKQAVDSYMGIMHQARSMPTANSTAPTVLPTSGGTPSNQSPVNVSDEDRRKMGAEMLRAAFKDN